MTLHYYIENEPDWDEEGMTRSMARKYHPLEFEYDVDTTFEDFFEYVRPSDFNTWQEEGQKAYRQAVLDLWDKNFIDWQFEEDDDFIEFMKDKYYDEALDWYDNSDKGEPYEWVR